MGTSYESGKDWAAKGEGWDPHFICCAQDKLASNLHGFFAMENIYPFNQDLQHGQTQCQKLHLGGNPSGPLA